MGHYSQLYLDKYYFAWKYDIPSFLSFFFKEDMFYKETGESLTIDSSGKEVRETFIDEIGYKCTAKESIEILDKLGYDFERITDLYGFFYRELIGEVEESILNRIADDNSEADEIELEKIYEEYNVSHQVLTREEELRHFSQLLPELITSSHSNSSVDNNTIIDFEGIQMYLLGKELQYPPWITLIARLFDWEMLNEYSEVLAMFYFRIFLEAIPSDSPVKLDLQDIIDEEEEVKELHTDLASKLIDKINLYNKFFTPLITKEDFVREKYIKSKGEELLKDCLQEDNSFKKGQLLEILIELIFTSNKSLDVSSRRVKTGDEEIDLVIINKMTTAFWLAFGAMFFVECKNWKSPIGAKEMRDFETKLRNHQNVTSLGFFVCINGFTKEAVNHLKRIGRESYHIVIIDKADIEDYLQSQINLFEWLENKMQIIY